MAVEVRLPTILRPHAGGVSSIAAEANTVNELVELLVSTHPALKGQLMGGDGSLHRFVNVYRNDDDIRYLDALETTLDDGDVVSIVPAVAGG